MADVADVVSYSDALGGVPTSSQLMVEFARGLRSLHRRLEGTRVSVETPHMAFEGLHAAVEALGGLEHMGPTISHGLVAEIEELLMVQGVLNEEGAIEYCVAVARVSNDAADEITAYLRRIGMVAAAVESAGFLPPWNLEPAKITIPGGTAFEDIASDGRFMTTNYTVTFDVGATTNVMATVMEDGSYHIGHDGEVIEKAKGAAPERNPTLSELWRD